MKRQLLFSCTVACTLLAISACGNTVTSPTDTAATDAATTAEVTEETEEEVKYTDNLGEFDFGGAEYRVRTIENANVVSYMNVEEETGDALDDAMYRRNRTIEERFNIVFKEELCEDNSAPMRKIIMAGDDAFEIGNLRCTDAPTFYTDGLIYSIDDVPYIDLSQPYWAAKLNKSITVGGHQFTAVGAYDINVMDLTFALVFNKQMVTDFDMGNLYDLVNQGKWTMDEMLTLMQQVLADLNGDGVYDGNDRWGYLGHPKQVCPNFWIAAGEMSILKDESDNPYINMSSDRFISVFKKIYDITWNANTLYETQDLTYDIPTENITVFTEGNALFMDTSLFYIESLRDMEIDFGILPYPKYDEAQSEYYSRVSYYWATVVPVTNAHLEMTGVILEALQCESANTVVPAYYDVALKAKYSRDEESAAMLDLIQANRVVDIGDTLLCGTIRDGFIQTMYKKKDSDLASQLAKKEKAINKALSQLPLAEG